MLMEIMWSDEGNAWSLNCRISQLKLIDQLLNIKVTQICATYVFTAQFVPAFKKAKKNN